VAGHPRAWHNGMTASYTAFNGMLLDNGLVVIVLTNMRVNEITPLLPLGQQMVLGVCLTSQTAANC
jgi:hypothetical protein